MTLAPDLQLYLLVNLNEMKQRPEIFNHFFTSARRKNKLVPPETNLEIYKHSPNYRFITIYKYIPENLKKKDKVDKFKNRVKHFLVNISYYSITEFTMMV